MGTFFRDTEQMIDFYKIWIEQINFFNFKPALKKKFFHPYMRVKAL